jgi:hypothetical protein
MTGAFQRRECTSGTERWIQRKLRHGSRHRNRTRDQGIPHTHDGFLSQRVASGLTRGDQARPPVQDVNTTPDCIRDSQHQRPVMGNRAGMRIVGTAVQKRAILLAGKFRQKQNELHGAPLRLSLHRSSNRNGHRDTQRRAHGRAPSASECESTARRAVPLMRLRLEGASDCHAATNCGVCYQKRTASLKQRDSGKGNEAGLRSVSLSSPLSRGASRATIQEESPFYDTGVQYMGLISGVNSGCEYFAKSLRSTSPSAALNPT